MAATLAHGLQPVSVDWNTLHDKYNPLLSLVRELIGIVPNCDPVLEIWPPGFRTYNLLVPNMFNLPNTLFGGKSFKASMGLAMYASSKAACAYCTAHACSFALRRGARPEAIAGSRTDREQAVVTLAEKLAHIPSSLTMADIESVQKYFSASESEGLVYAISMMGFLNKFMDAMGIELEQEAINDTAELLSRTGWKPGVHVKNDYRVTAPGTLHPDTIFTYLRVIRHAPGAVLWERKWTKGVPASWQEAGVYLEKRTGYAFPVLQPVKEARVVRALTTVLRDNLDSQVTVSGLKVKMYAGYVFSTVVANEVLKSEIKNLAVHLAPELDEGKLEQLAKMAQTEVPMDRTTSNTLLTSIQQSFSLTDKEAAAVLLAVAASHSPAQVNDAVMEPVLKVMEPAGIVEINVWLSVLQLLNRLSSYYNLVKGY